jgi:hypothetical protein
MTVDRNIEPADATLVERLRPLVERDDPVPPEVVAAAQAALTWQRIDAELAELAGDSLSVAAGVRGAAARLLTYQAGGITIEVEVVTADDRVRILGQLVPPQPAHLRVEQPAGPVEVTADALGRFRVTGLTPGPTRLWCAPIDPDGAAGAAGPAGAPAGAAVCTQWTLL